MYFVIAKILFLALGSASLTNLFDDCIQKGMIFSKWGDLIRDKSWGKPLGGCMICTNVWMTILISILYLTVQPLALVLITLGVSNTALKFILR